MARYDGLADWYDERVGAQEGTAVLAEAAVRLLGPGQGRTLVDIGCGTGLFFRAWTESGWDVTGIDISADQLRVARARTGKSVPLLRSDASELPCEDGSFDAAALLRVMTDVDEPASVLREAARVVRRNGRIVLAAPHPCFVGPYVVLEVDGSRRALPGYRSSGWHTDGPGLGDGIRRRVGVRHLTLSELLNAIAHAGLTIEQSEEPGGEPLPTLLLLQLRHGKRI